jgi:hypothetical protein
MLLRSRVAAARTTIPVTATAMQESTRVTRGLDPRVHHSLQELFAKRMDCRVISAFTRVFDALCPAMTKWVKTTAMV